MTINYQFGDVDEHGVCYLRPSHVNTPIQPPA
jgi:hypothetical protein